MRNRRLGAGRLLSVAGTVPGRAAPPISEPPVGWVCDRIALRRWSPHHARGSQPRAIQNHARRCEALFAGALITFAAIATRTPTLLLAGSAVAGIGWGPAFLGAYDTIVTLARPEDRAGLIAAIFTVGFLALSIPAVIAGIATSHYGLHKTALVYTAVVAVLAATAAGTFLIRRARRPSTRRRKRWHELATSFT